jgi:hypothetical protein
MPKEKGKFIGKNSLRTIDLITGRAAQVDSGELLMTSWTVERKSSCN